MSEPEKMIPEEHGDVCAHGYLRPHCDICTRAPLTAGADDEKAAREILEAYSNDLDEQDQRSRGNE